MEQLNTSSLSGTGGLEDLPTEIYCSACRLKFEDLTSYKLHLTTEFHVYNARRKTAELAPISQILFEQKKKDLLSCLSSEQSEHNYYCKDCKRAYQSPEMLDQHLNSKKHKAKAKKSKKMKNSFSTQDGASNSNQMSDHHSDNPFEEIDKTLTEDSKIEEPRKTTMDSLKICLFSNNVSNSVKENLDYMRVNFSFYVLDIDCLISLKALLHYLAEKIHVGFTCIHCNKIFRSSLACQNHMKDMRHCTMNSELFEEEYEYFYDFAPTYDENFVGKCLDDFDLTEEPLAKPLSEKIFSKVKNEEAKEANDMEQVDNPMEDIVEEDGDGDWEDINGEEVEEAQAHVDQADSSAGSFQKVSAPSSSSYTMIDPSKTHTSDPVIQEEAKSIAQESNLSEAEVTKLLERRKKNRFDYQVVTDTYKAATVLDTGEVQLADGRILGHRQWAREYKQRIPVRDIKEAAIIKRLGIEYKKLGQEGTVSTHFNHQHIINHSMRKFNLNKELHKQKKQQTKVDKKSNKTKLTHFRDQLLQ